MTVAVHRKTAEHARRTPGLGQSVGVLAERDRLGARDSCPHTTGVEFWLVIGCNFFELQHHPVFLSVVREADAAKSKGRIDRLS
ncbi:MAG: hypothetical protein RL552_892 [Actinomycetota bacterium]